MKSFIFAGFAIISITSASRIFNVHESTEQDILGDSGDREVLADVTQDVLKLESSGTTAIRCCCDAVSSRPSSWFDYNNRSGRCQIFTKEKAFKCNSVTLPTWLTHTGTLNHFNKLKDPRCLIPDDEAEQLYRTHGTADNYCSLFHVDDTLAGAAALGKDSTVTCDAGFKPEMEHVTCTWKSIQEGIFDPQPKCTLDEEWCPTVEIPQVLSVAATELDAVSPVLCAAGYEPVQHASKCTTDRSFRPTPECKPISNYCVFHSYYGGPSVQSAAKNEWVPIKCPLGTVPSSETTQCTEAGTFEPQPYCTKVWDFCQSITTKPEPGQLFTPGPTVDSAPLGSEELVRCRIGWEAQPTTIKCTESGNFDHEPKCLKNWNWCSSYEEGDTYVRQAGRDDLQTVQCSHKDYKPATDYVKCDKDHQFKPTPACVLK